VVGVRCQHWHDSENLGSAITSSDIRYGTPLGAIYTSINYVGAGPLLAYGPDLDSLFANLAHQANQIFKGANPRDIPIQQATTYRFVINTKTAKGLGLTIPKSLLARADEAIE
jgi:putative tryptophan/tyrosine transport system substrate-binding protein